MVSLVKRDRNQGVVSSNEGKLTNRLAIMALLSAIVFGINQMFGDKKLPIGTDLTLSVISTSFITIVLPLFIIYLLGLSMNYRYASKNPIKWHLPFYDLGISLSAFIVLFASMTVIALKLAVYFDSVTFGVWGIALRLIITGLILERDIRRPILEIWNQIKQYAIPQLKKFIPI